MLMNLVEVISHYNETHRHYHNLTHIRRMFDLAEKLDVRLTSAQAIAVLFHDAVYDTSTKTNEEDSVKLMRRLCAPQNEADEADLHLAEQIILNTKKHEIKTIGDNGCPIHPGHEIGIVLDLDLAELGADWDRYCYNEQNIRREYSQYSDEQWKAGRVQFLEGMLSKEYIYNTGLFRQHFEAKARDNIISAITELGSK